MAGVEETAKLTLSLPVSIKAMIKADAKALGMTPSGYVSMVCRAVNEEARSEGMQEMIHAVTEAATKAVAAEYGEK